TLIFQSSSLPRTTRTLPGFKSLCSTPRSCAAATAFPISTSSWRRVSNGILVSPPWASAHSARFAPAYSLSRKKGAASKFHSRIRTNSRRIPKRFSKKPATLNPPLQALQPHAVGGKLENGLLVVFRLPREPHLA